MQTETPSSEHMIRVGLATPPGALRAGVRALLANAARIVVAAEVSSLDEFNGLPADVDVIVATSGAVRRSAAETIVHAPLLVLAADDGLNWHKLERISPRVWGTPAFEHQSTNS
jgi:hypothetical protein